MTLEENIIFPEADGFKGKVLDEHLAAGFYRMQFFMFTAYFTQIEMDSAPLPVFWLRTKVQHIKNSRTVASIRNRCKQFTVSYKQAAVTDEIEVLYRQYRDHIDFNASDSCRSYLENNYITNPFDARMIEVRDAGRLVAIGYFDCGKESLAGILNFYHPDYRKCSLGKFLMLKKIDYALQNNYTLYYTGYISTTMDKFDYKIFPDVHAMEVFLPLQNQWCPYADIGKSGLQAYVSVQFKM